jgi:hypothetical protein
MRSIVASITMVMLAGIGSGFAVGSAAALPKIEAANVDSSLATDIGWRRDYRRGQVTVAPVVAITQTCNRCRRARSPTRCRACARQLR